MVFFHDGSPFYMTGNSRQITGLMLARKEVIVVSVSSRLGALGYLSTQDSHAWGNYGLMDQHKALKWVHDNIEAFGGRIGKITAVGQGSGAAGVALLLVSPKSRQNRKRVIDSAVLLSSCHSFFFAQPFSIKLF